MIKTKSNEWILNNWRGSQKYKVRKKKWIEGRIGMVKERNNERILGEKPGREDWMNPY